MNVITENQSHIDEVIKGPESHQWKEAIKEELIQIEKLHTWEIVEASPGTNIIGSQFILCCKCDVQGNISCYKAWHITKGLKQKFGVNYTETFTPTVCASTLCVLLSIATTLGDKVVIEQANVKNAYLNSWLHKDEVIYAALPSHYLIFHFLSTEFANKPLKMIVLWI